MALIKIEEMEKLVADARPGDRFYFHCILPFNVIILFSNLNCILDSGHGTHLPDDNGDEEDGWDECMYCYARFFHIFLYPYKI